MAHDPHCSLRLVVRAVDHGDLPLRILVACQRRHWTPTALIASIEGEEWVLAVDLIAKGARRSPDQLAAWLRNVIGVLDVRVSAPVSPDG